MSFSIKCFPQPSYNIKYWHKLWRQVAVFCVDQATCPTKLIYHLLKLISFYDEKRRCQLRPDLAAKPLIFETTGNHSEFTQRWNLAKLWEKYFHALIRELHRNKIPQQRTGHGYLISWLNDSLICTAISLLVIIILSDVEFYIPAGAGSIK